MIISPVSWWISLVSYLPALADMILRNCKVTINVQAFYYACEGCKDVALDVVWDDGNLTKLLFSLMTAPDIGHSHGVFTHFTRLSLDNTKLNPETASAQLSQWVAEAQFAVWHSDTGYHNPKGLIRLSPRALVRDNPVVSKSPQTGP
jgi:hypothetical protein